MHKNVNGKADCLMENKNVEPFTLLLPLSLLLSFWSRSLEDHLLVTEQAMQSLVLQGRVNGPDTVNSLIRYVTRYIFQFKVDGSR